MEQPLIEGYGAWVEWSGGECPVDDRQVSVMVVIRGDPDFPFPFSPPFSQYWWRHDGSRQDILTYCVRPKAQSAVKRLPSAPAKAASPNARMLERDGSPLPAPVVTPAPGFMLDGFRSPEPGLLVVAPFDHRPGRWS